MVTGAGRGIGRAIARKLSQQGASVLCLSRTSSELEETIAGAEGAHALAIDIAAEASGRHIVQRAMDGLGRIDMLIHSAGVFCAGTLDQLDFADFDRLFRINVRAPYALTQTALPVLKQAKGQIVFVNSTILRAANIAGRGTFAATQCALKALADSIRDEVNATGVRVLSVMPGTTATPRQEALFAAVGRDYHPERLLQPDDVAEVVCAALALPRTAEATDLFVRPMLAG